MESPPPLESQQKFLAPADIWPQGTAFNYHAGLKPCTDINWYTTKGLNNRYGAATGAADYSNKSELLNYESERSFFEAWNANKYTKSFGTIYWMLDNAWPSTHWNLYDYYFKPGGGYFGTKKANEPVHILWDYFGQNVIVENSTLSAANNLTASVNVYNIPDLSVKYTNQVVLNAAANAATQAFTIRAISGLSTTYFIRAQLRNSSNQLVSNNLYWYSTTPDTLGNHSTWYNTSISGSADLTGLNSLAANSNLAVSASKTSGGGNDTVTVTLTNNDPTNIAFFVRAEVTAGNDGLEVLPVTYTDNYITLWPGESITITAQYAARPSLSAHGMHATFFVNSGVIGDSAHMTWTQLADLYADGNEIAGHTLTHANLKHMKTAAARQEVCGDRVNLFNHGFQPTSFAYPFGSFDSATKQVVVDCGYNSGRGVSGGTETIPPLDAYATRTPPNPKKGTTLATIESYVTSAEGSGGGWVQLVFHHVCDGCDAYSITPANLTALLDWLQPRSASGTIVLTTTEVIGGTVMLPVQP